MIDLMLQDNKKITVNVVNITKDNPDAPSFIQHNKLQSVPAGENIVEPGDMLPDFSVVLNDASVVDEVMPVPDDEAIRGGRELASTEGLLAGISSGAVVYAARQLAGRPEFKGKMIVTLLPDTGERYLTTELFAFDAYPLD